MGEFVTPEILWVNDHDTELIGLATEEAVDIVQAAGFMPQVIVTGMGIAVAANYVYGSVRIFSYKGLVKRVAAG